MISFMNEAIEVLRREFEAEEGSFLLRLRGDRAMLRTCGSVPGGHAEGVPSRMIRKVSE
jgi:hypothetical protein